jgi:hypothetical protein
MRKNYREVPTVEECRVMAVVISNPSPRHFLEQPSEQWEA